MPERRRSRSFAPTVLAGLAGAVLMAIAAGRDWASATGDAAGVTVRAAARGSASAPLVLALALVALAAWGVVLVLRARARRVVAALGAVASIGALASALAASGRLTDDARAAVVTRGATGAGIDTSLTGWYVVAVAGAVLTAAAFVVAVRVAGTWPAMGSRYDAPGTRPREVAEQDLWRAIDEGHDPTL
jgi:uncharacterized membrane protein (TIGR02234 family)